MPALREVLGEHGHYVPSTKSYPTAWSYGYLADEEKMAEIIKKVLEMPPDERKKRMDAQLEYVKKFSWERIVEQWEALFKQHKELGLPI